MSGSATAVRIDAADAFARTLYLRIKQTSSPAFDDVAVAVRQMHITLRHLRREAGDGKSVLNRPESAGYMRQLQPIVEDVEFALKQLETVLGRFDNASGPAEASGLTDRIASITARIAQEEMNVAFFLDTVQVRPSDVKAGTAPLPDKATFDEIKEEVDDMASRIFSRHNSVLDNDAHALWLEFKPELERQGFTSDELETHKASIQAYIRQLGSSWNRSCGATPTYQSVAEFQANTAPQVQHPVHPPVIPPKVPILPPKENAQPPVNEKTIPSTKQDRYGDNKMAATILPTQYSFNAPVEDEKANDLSMALISTHDLVAMDGLSNGMSNMNLYSQPPQASHLAPNAAADGPNSQMLSASPRYHSSHPAGEAASYLSSSPNRPSKLAPDRYGRDIPQDAQWTKVRRTLISPEVLNRAGVRYEARPEYVAILGRLSREEIAEFARQSAECRSSRSDRPPLPPRRADGNTNGYRDDKHYKPEAKNHHSDDDVLHDESDSTDYEDDRSSDKGTRSYPYIVNAPSKTKTSPSTTVKPKPILKNKNENHVRFDPEPHEVEHPSSAPSSYHHDRRRDHYGDGSRRHRDYDRDYDRDYHGRGERRHGGHRDRRDRGRKKSWGETLGAVGIGSAALLLGGVGGF